MKDFENHLKLNVNSLKTVQRYTEYLLQFFRKYNDCNQETVNNFLTTFISQGKKSAFNIAIASLKHFAKFKHLNIEFPKPKKITRKNVASLTKEEIEKEIIVYFPMMFKNYQKRITIFRFMILSMLRISEVVSLKKEDIDFETMKISVKSGKGDKDRITFLHDSIKDDVMNIVNQSKSDLAFDITKNYIIYMFDMINKQLNYKKHITPHTTRRAGAKYMIENNMRVEQLQKILGHKSLDTTNLYIETSIDEIYDVFKNIKYKKGC